MKNHICFVTACATLVISRLALGQFIASTQVSLAGHNGPQYSYDSGIVNGPTDHNSGDLPGPSTVSASGSASFGLGFVKVSAAADEFTPSGDTAGITAVARGTYADTYTPVAGPIGTLITITAAWTLHGSNFSSLALKGSGVAHDPFTTLPAYVEGEADSELSIAGTGISDAPVLWAEDDQFANNIPGSSPLNTKFDPNPIVPLTFSAISGLPIPLSVTLEADAIVGVTSFTTADGGSADALSNFGHTLLWGGISSITDSKGNPISNWSVTSASGFDYSQPATEPVPEPSTFLLLAIALPGLFPGRTKR